jgi:Kinesin motor domain
VVEALFTAVTEADESIEFTFKVTYVEIYMEKIRDLLDESRVKVRIVLLIPDHWLLPLKMILNETNAVAHFSVQKYSTE